MSGNNLANSKHESHEAALAFLAKVEPHGGQKFDNNHLMNIPSEVAVAVV
jgi:hypothetical protein